MRPQAKTDLDLFSFDLLSYNRKMINFSVSALVLTYCSLYVWQQVHTQLPPQWGTFVL